MHIFSTFYIIRYILLKETQIYPDVSCKVCLIEDERDKIPCGHLSILDEESPIVKHGHLHSQFCHLQTPYMVKKKRSIAMQFHINKFASKKINTYGLLLMGYDIKRIKSY